MFVCVCLVVESQDEQAPTVEAEEVKDEEPELTSAPDNHEVSQGQYFKI